MRLRSGSSAARCGRKIGRRRTRPSRDRSPPHPRRPRHRRRRDRHARPLARAGRDPGLRGRQARVRREAVQPQLPREPIARGRGPPQQRRRAARHAAAQPRRSPPMPSRCSAKASSATCWWPRPGTSSAAKTSATRSRPPSPAGVDYDLWVGPAEMVPFQPNRFHTDWHWWYNFGTGDIGNDGTHEIDYARWGLGVDTLPTKVSAIGGKYFFDDDQQFPDTATCVFEYPATGEAGHRRQLMFEMRLWSKNYPYNCDSGVEFFGTKGRMLLSKRGKLIVVDDDNKTIRDEQGRRPTRLGPLRQFRRRDPRQPAAERRHRRRPSQRGADSPGEHRDPRRPVARFRSRERSRSSATRRPASCSRAPIASDGHWAMPQGV